VKTPIETIIFPVDLSVRSRLAAPYVRALAGRFQANVVALHCVDPADHMMNLFEAGGVSPDSLRARWHAQAVAQLGLFADLELAGLPVERHVEEGPPAPHILALAHRLPHPCIMMPSHGFSAFRRFVLGSTTARVLHEAECPVWTAAIHEEGQDAAQHVPQKILAAVSFDDRSAHVLRYAATLARDCGAQLLAAHATAEIVTPAPEWGAGDISAKVNRQAYQALASLLEKLEIQAGMEVASGPAGRVIGDIALRHKVDLAVIARGAVQEGAGRLRAHSYSIVNAAPCPVLSV